MHETNQSINQSINQLERKLSKKSVALEDAESSLSEVTKRCESLTRKAANMAAALEEQRQRTEALQVGRSVALIA